MKRFLSVLVLLGFFWGGSLSLFSPVFAQDDTPVETPSETPAATTPTSRTCAQIIEDAKTDPPEPEIKGEIVVLLTEQIKSGGNNIPCSRVIECLRLEKSKPNPSGVRPLASEVDSLVIADLKKNYSQCILAGKDGLDLLNNYARLVYQWIAGIVGSICILIIILSGIQISIGGLSQEEVGSAKERISRSLVGLAVLFLSAFILYSINPIFFS
jgi:hypothetical protein